MPPLIPETDSEGDEESLPTADIDDLVRDEEPVPDSRECLCICEICRLSTTPPQPVPVTQLLQLDQGIPAMSPQQPDQVEVPLHLKLMELDTTEDVPNLLDVPEEVMSDFDVWAQDVLSYQF